MPDAKWILLFLLAILTVVYVVGWSFEARRARQSPSAGPAGARGAPTPFEVGLGFVTNFFDTLGIGNFATTTSVFKLRGMVPDQLIPGTLNAGHALPVIAEAFIFVAILQVEPLTLILMIIAAILGAWLGAGVVAGWPRRKVQIGMGIALLAAAILMLMTQLDLFPPGGDTLGLGGLRLVAGVSGNFALGALMTLGIGLYAPCMILVSLLGMNPKGAFPIMMGSCAFLMPVGSLRFIRKGSYSLKAALGLTFGGIPGVLIAAYLVRALPLGAVRWLVVVVVVYTATMMLRSAITERRAAAAASETRPAPSVQIPG